MNPILLFLYKDVNTLGYNPLVNTIHVYHLLSILFIYFGWLLSKKYIWMYILYVGFTLVSWQWNIDVCPMTEFEYQSRGWDIHTTPSFTQLFLVRPFIQHWIKSDDPSLEIQWTNYLIQLIYILFIIAIIRWII